MSVGDVDWFAAKEIHHLALDVGIVQIPQVILHAVHGRGDFRPTEVFCKSGW